MQNGLDTQTRARQFSLNIISLIDQLPKETSMNILAKQLLRAATSIGANIVEAKGGSSRRDFTNFFHHALKSSNETIYWLELIRDSGKSPKMNVDGLIKEANELSKILGSSILTLKGKRTY